MNPALAALDGVVDRHGRALLTDPIALAAALRGAPEPLAEPEIAALAAVAGSGAVERMREVLRTGGDAAAAHSAAVVAARDAAGPRTAWACAQLGAALGLLSRQQADGPDAEPTALILGAAPPRRTRGPLVAVVAVLAVVALVAAGAFLVGRSTDVAPGRPSAAAAPVTTAPATTAPPATRAATDPHTAFSDPALLAAAEPYLGQPGTKCRADKPGLNQAESVTCVLGGSVLGIFKKMLTPGAVAELRRSFQRGDAGAQQGSVRSLRWESVPGQPGVRVGVATGSGRAGEGTRVRFLDAESGFARLYFDVDATGVAVFLGTESPDQTLLRAYWADPDA